MCTQHVPSHTGRDYPVNIISTKLACLRHYRTLQNPNRIGMRTLHLNDAVQV
jgi:hypothetical protein